MIMNNNSRKFDLKSFATSKDILEIKLTGIKNITNMSDLFNDCKYLLNINEISEMDTSNITDMSRIFSNCESLISLPDISKWNTFNAIEMNGIFDYCASLISLPDISNWNISNVISNWAILNRRSTKIRFHIWMQGPLLKVISKS